MVRIRLRRVGSRHQPSYRLIVADEESPRDGRFLENLGHHNPRTFPATTVVDEGRVFYWLGVGAQPSESARRVLTTTGCWARWERVKGGESLEAILAEAAQVTSEVDPRTSQTGSKPARLSKKARSRAEAAAEPAAEA
ncbi:MAG TPA: 30S ribosomal protein S16 [Anaerolineales bacterium]|nr:30S ribosomal protein S16 [Anaerolineales bacterium]